MILSGQIQETVLARTLHFFHMVWERVTSELVSPWADLSIFSLCFALLVAVVWSMRGRRRPIRVLIRAMFPRRWLSGPSARADWGFVLLNRFVAGSLVAWAIISGSTIGDALHGWLIEHFGPVTHGLPHSWVSALFATLVIYLAYEFAYYTSHYLSHHFEPLWQFHRVHHLAETLSPLTNNRVHPVDSIVFYNFIALFTGGAKGALAYFLPSTQSFELDGANAFLIIALYLVTHLQHSHIWLPLTGTWGKIVMSPAHHQLHHSDDPAHFNCNFGNSIALFDWLGGTLIIPKAKRQKLKFGAGTYPVDPHTVHGGLIQPFIEATRPMQRLLGRSQSILPAEAEPLQV